jgi:mannose-6-phosphate isomerase-like protein (cupin superfamily)
MSKISSISIVFVSFVILTAQASSPDKNTRTVISENEKVRISEVIEASKDQNPGMHTHQYPHVAVILQGGYVRIINADGTKKDLQVKTGDTFYEDPTTHETINLGKEDLRIIEVDIK